jgi:hypothetical protein
VLGGDQPVQAVVPVAGGARGRVGAVDLALVDGFPGPVVVVVPGDRLPGAELSARGVLHDPVDGSIGVVEGVVDGRAVGKLDLGQRPVGQPGVLVRVPRLPNGVAVRSRPFS